MELRHLRYFMAVAEELSFTKAAAKLHLAQPSLTRQVHNLEEELGVPLLNRSKSQVSLTEEGRSFLIDTRRILALAAESIQAVQRLSRGETGQLNIGYVSHFNYEALPKTLQAFRKRFPHTALNLFDMTPAEQLRALTARKMDLGFVGLCPPLVGGRLQSECIARHKTIVLLSSSDSLAKKPRINLTELKSRFFVGLSEQTHPGFREWLSGTCQQASGFTPKILQEAELEPGLISFVAEGLGVALSREQIRKLPHTGVVFRPVAPTIEADYCIVWNRDNDSKALQEYINIVKSAAGALVT